MSDYEEILLNVKRYFKIDKDLITKAVNELMKIQIKN